MAIKRIDEIHQQVIAGLLARKPRTEIALELGIHRNTIGKWEKDPLFQAELKKTVVQRTHGRLDELVNAMMDTAITEGNAAMAKLVLQMNDMLTDKVSVESRTADSSVDYDALDDEIKAFAERFNDGEDKRIEH